MPFCCADDPDGAFGLKRGPIIPLRPLKSEPSVSPRAESRVHEGVSMLHELRERFGGSWESLATILPAVATCAAPIPSPIVPPIARMRLHCAVVSSRSDLWSERWIPPCEL